MKKDYPSDNMPLDSYACDSHVYKLKIILKAVFYRAKCLYFFPQVILLQFLEDDVV